MEDLLCCSRQVNPGGSCRCGGNLQVFVKADLGQLNAASMTGNLAMHFDTSSVSCLMWQLAFPRKYILDAYFLCLAPFGLTRLCV